MNKIKVIHCLGQLNTGGAETLVLNVFRKINKDKFQFDFLLFNNDPGFYDNEVKQLGGEIYYLPSISNVGIICYIRKMINFFKEYQPDIVHSHMDWQGGFIAYAAHKAGVKKIIVHSHANQKMFEVNFIYKLMIKINKRLIKKYANYCLACSKIAGDSLFNKGYEIIFNGIDLDKFININLKKMNDLKIEFGIKPNDIVLGTVGSLSENKNQIFLIEILSELVKINEHYKLIIVGEGKEKKKLENRVLQLNLNENVYFAGRRSEIPEIMHLFDIFLLPSKMEGLGIVAIEAQSCGLQCIISNTVPKDVVINKKLVEFLPLIQENWIECIKNIKFYQISIKENELKNSEFNILKTCENLERIYIS